MRAAVPLVAATAPPRLAMCNPSIPTGKTIAMKSKAASTSASVKPACRPGLAQVCSWPHLLVCAADFIVQLVIAFDKPETDAISAAEADFRRAGLANGPVWQKADSR